MTQGTTRFLNRPKVVISFYGGCGECKFCIYIYIYTPLGIVAIEFMNVYFKPDLPPVVKVIIPVHLFYLQASCLLISALFFPWPRACAAAPCPKFCVGVLPCLFVSHGYIFRFSDMSDVVTISQAFPLQSYQSR